MEEANRKNVETNEKLQSEMRMLREGTITGKVKGRGIVGKIKRFFN